MKSRVCARRINCSIKRSKTKVSVKNSTRLARGKILNGSWPLIYSLAISREMIATEWIISTVCQLLASSDFIMSSLRRRLITLLLLECREFQRKICCRWASAWSFGKISSRSSQSCMMKSRKRARLRRWISLTLTKRITGIYSQKWVIIYLNLKRVSSLRTCGLVDCSQAKY